MGISRYCAGACQGLYKGYGDFLGSREYKVKSTGKTNGI